jgi:hypothetical protein
MTKTPHPLPRRHRSSQHAQWPGPGRHVAALALALAAGAVGAAPHAHDHGTAQMQIALDGPVLTLSLRLPMDGLVGFERAPRTDAERKAWGEALGRLRQADGLFKPDAAAQCRLEQAQVDDPTAVAPAGRGGSDKHADVDAEIRFRCAQPGQLRALDVGLLEAYPRIKRVEAVIVTAQGQRKLTLRRPARGIKLQR